MDQQNQEEEKRAAEVMNIQRILTAENVRTNFEKMLGKKAQGFITSVLQIVAGNAELQKAEPWSVYNAAATAATMDLPINNNLGFAWIVPYAGKAQFQMGYKGFTQLAYRTGQYERLNCLAIYENQFKEWNPFEEYLELDMKVPPEGKIHGYASGFKLINGFVKKDYWTTEKVLSHDKKYSKSFDNPKGIWKKDFEAMALKTPYKNMLSKWGVLSIEMQTAMIADQAVIKNPETMDVEYPDNEEDSAEEKAKKATEATNEAIRKQQEKAKRESGK
jgi:recombination protein RecT